MSRIRVRENKTESSTGGEDEGNNRTGVIQVLVMLWFKRDR